MDSEAVLLGPCARPSAASRPVRLPLLRASVPAILRLVPLGCLVLWCLGALLRCTVRDRWLPLAYPYYVLTPPVLTCLAALAALLWYRRRMPLAAALALLLTAGSVGWSVRTNWSAAQRVPATREPVRVLFWNTARGLAGWSNLAAEIRGSGADVVGLVEAGRDQAAMQELWRKLLPEYDLVLSYAGILVAARGELQKVHASTCAPWGRHVLARVRVRGQAFYVLVFDVSHTIYQPRSVALDSLYAVLEELEDQPVVVLGDFNTPPDSMYFDRLRQGYRNAFESAGEGYAATWPVPAPVLQLDQAWVSPQLNLQRVTAGWSWKSDHRPLRLELTVPPSAPLPGD